MANYNEIDDILAEEEVEQGSKTELPFWLARELHMRQAVSIGVPACFKSEADAACVDLRSRCPYFYEFGCKLAPLCDKTIGLLLPYAFRISIRKSYTRHTPQHLPQLPNF
ncbi:DNA replication complex GINS protein PSF3 [Populus alba x Populus x berolinensis]|nr:DNA replication complex GINS protein PSF3 [Populus alba x Populus x berolinensis]